MGTCSDKVPMTRLKDNHNEETFPTWKFGTRKVRGSSGKTLSKELHPGSTPTDNEPSVTLLTAVPCGCGNSNLWLEAGRLKNFVNECHKITNDPHILDIVTHCHLDINLDDISYLFS